MLIQCCVCDRLIYSAIQRLPARTSEVLRQLCAEVPLPHLPFSCRTESEMPDADSYRSLWTKGGI